MTRLQAWPPSSCAARLFTFVAATLQNLFHFGLLAGSIVLVAMAADFLLVPAIIQLAGAKTGERRLR